MELFVAALLGMFLVFDVVGKMDGLLYLWPGTAIQLALLLPRWKSRGARVGGQLGGVAGVVAGGYLTGQPLWFAVALGAVSGVDVWVSGAILGKGIGRFADLKRRRNLGLFTLGALAGPCLGALPAALALRALLPLSFGRLFANSLMADSLGIAVMLPVLLLALTSEAWERQDLLSALRSHSWALALFLAVTLGVFWQTSYPFLFLVFPPMVMVILVLGLEGSVFVSVVLSLAAYVATAHGHGPLWLSKVSSLADRLLVLQVFLWMSAATALPVGSLLAQRRRAEREAADARSVYETLLDHTEDMIVLSSMDGSERYVSAACKRLTGWTTNEYMAMDRLSTVHPEDRAAAAGLLERMRGGELEQTLRCRLAHADGGWRWVETSTRAYMSRETGEVRGYVGTVRDISELRATEAAWGREMEALSQEKQQLEEQSLTDALTRLPNRRAFDLEVARVLRGSVRGQRSAALLMVDVDHFKPYNDRYGHLAGDECLREIGLALRLAAGRPHDFVARWGGEEFAVLLPETHAVGALRVAQGILQLVRELRIAHAGSPLGVATVSIGVAMLECAGTEDIDAWVQRADGALYNSKRLGRDRATMADAVKGV